MSPLAGLVSLFLLAVVGVDAHSIGHPGRHLRRHSGSGSWYHDPSHNVHALFKRQAGAFPVGSAEWTAAFPASIDANTAIPAEWQAAFDKAVAAGKIPDLPIPVKPGPFDTPVYPDGFLSDSAEICSSSSQCRGDGDIWDAVDGEYGISFDDGPQPFSPQLVDFLVEKNEKATHFLVGQAILQFPTEFLKIHEAGSDLAVHTYSHRHMTALGNHEAIAELGWTMELIRQSSGGKIPKFWRPAFGDADNRIRAIAKEVFGLTMIMWNKDTNDWQIESKQKTQAQTKADLESFINGPKSPGLVVLEHETSAEAVQVFKDTYALLKSKGWKVKSAAQLTNAGGAGGAHRTSGVNGPGAVLVNAPVTVPTPEPQPSASEPPAPGPSSEPPTPSSEPPTPAPSSAPTESYSATPTEPADSQSSVSSAAPSSSAVPPYGSDSGSTPVETPAPGPGNSYPPTDTPAPSPSGSHPPTDTPAPAPGGSYPPTDTPAPAPGGSYPPNDTPAPAPGNSYPPADTPAPAPGNSHPPADTPAPAPGNSYPPASGPSGGNHDTPVYNPPAHQPSTGGNQPTHNSPSGGSGSPPVNHPSKGNTPHPYGDSIGAQPPAGYTGSYGDSIGNADSKSTDPKVVVEVAAGAASVLPSSSGSSATPSSSGFVPASFPTSTESNSGVQNNQQGDSTTSPLDNAATSMGSTSTLILVTAAAVLFTNLFAL